MQIHNPNDVFSHVNPQTESSEGNKIYIDIDNSCFVAERVLMNIFRNNHILRYKIIKNTNKTVFNNTTNLTPTRSNMKEFIQKCKNNFSYVAYVTCRQDEINKIKEELTAHNLPIDIDIVNINQLEEKYEEVDNQEDKEEKKIYYIGSNNNISNKITTFKLSLI